MQKDLNRGLFFIYLTLSYEFSLRYLISGNTEMSKILRINGMD